MRRLDAIVGPRLGSVKTFFKIDTQGYELRVLKGMESWLGATTGWMIKMEFVPYWLHSQGTDLSMLLDYVNARYEFVEFPARVTFGTPAMDALFATRIAPDEHGDFFDHVASLDRDGRGWVDLLIRPRDSNRPPSG